MGIACVLRRKLTVAKGILTSPMYIYNKNAAAYWGIWGGVQSEIVPTTTTNTIY